MTEAILKGETGILKRYSATAAMDVGAVEVVGSRVCVLAGSKAVEIGDDYSLHTLRRFEMAAKTSDAWSDGDLLYWDDTNKELTSTAGSNKSAGLADGDKSAGATTAVCDLNASVASGTI